MTIDTTGRAHKPAGSPASTGGQFEAQAAPGASASLPDWRDAAVQDRVNDWAAAGGVFRPETYEEATRHYGHNAAAIVWALDAFVQHRDEIESDPEALLRNIDSLEAEPMGHVNAARTDAYRQSAEAGRQLDRALVDTGDLTQGWDPKAARQARAVIAMIGRAANAPVDRIDLRDARQLA